MRLGAARDSDGVLYLPAQQVTSLLRGEVGQFQDWGHDEEEPAPAPATLALVTAALLDAADQIDVECIARTGQHTQEDGQQ